MGDDQYAIDLDDSLDADKNCVGYWVDLDVTDAEGPYYEIVSQPSDTQIVVAAMDDLAGAGLAGNELTGVHRLAGLEVAGGAIVDFGDDLLVLDDLSETQATAYDSIHLSAANAALFDALAATEVGGTWHIDQSFARDTLVLEGPNLNINDLSITNDLTVRNNVSLGTTSVDAGGTIEIDGGSLSTIWMGAGGDLNLSNNAVVTCPEADDTQWHTLQIDVAGAIRIESGSSIDVTGKGYLRGRT
jgi:hypothetical protein